MDSVGFVLPTGVAPGVTALALVDAWASQHPASHVVVYGHPALRPLSKHHLDWVDIAGVEARAAMRDALDSSMVGRSFSLGTDFFGEAIATVVSPHPHLLPGADKRLTAYAHWAKALDLQEDFAQVNWNYESQPLAADVLLVPGRASNSVWADHEWPEDAWLELAAHPNLSGASLGVLTLSDCKAAMELARLPNMQVVPEDLPLTTLTGLLRNMRAVVATDEGIATLAAILDVPTVLIEPATADAGWMARPGCLHRLQAAVGASLATIDADAVATVLNNIQVPLAYY